MDPYNMNLANAARYQRQRSLPAGVSDGGAGSSGSGDMANDGGDDSKKKKLLHRDIERQRRQEMAALFASLRDHLPLQYIKGKRAVSDHIHGAVNFIRDSQKRIKELGARRDDMKREMGLFINPDPTPAGPSHSDPACIIVQPCTSGVEVVINSTAAGPEALPLSRVLRSLQEKGLEVICSLITRVNERLMYTIQVEINSFACFDIARLQQKLVEELIFSAG